MPDNDVQQEFFDKSIEALQQIVKSIIENTGTGFSSNDTKNISTQLSKGIGDLIKDVFDKKKFKGFSDQFKKNVVIPLFEVIKKKIESLDTKNKNLLIDDLSKVFKLSDLQISDLRHIFKTQLEDILKDDKISKEISKKVVDNVKASKLTLIDEQTQSEFSKIFKFSLNDLHAFRESITPRLNVLLGEYVKRIEVAVSKSDIKVPTNLAELIQFKGSTVSFKNVAKQIEAQTLKSTTRQTASNKLDISNLMDFKKEIGPLTKIKYSKIVWDFLTKLSKNVNAIDIGYFDEIERKWKGGETGLHLNINQILGFTKELGYWTKKRYNILMWDVFSKIQPKLKNLKFTSRGVDGKTQEVDYPTLNIQDLLGIDKQLSLFSKYKFNVMMREMFSKIKDKFNDLQFINTDEYGKSIVITNPTLNIQELLGFDKVLNKKTKTKYNEVINKLLEKFDTFVDDVSFTPNIFDMREIFDIMNLGERADKLGAYFLKVMKKHIDGIELSPKKLDLYQMLNKKAAEIGQPPPLPSSVPQEQQSPRQDFLERKPIVELGPDTQKFLSGLMGKKEESQQVTTGIPSKKSSSGLLNSLLKGLGWLTKLGGLIPLIYGLFDSGPFKGLEKLIGRLNWDFSKYIPKVMSGILKGFTKFTSMLMHPIESLKALPKLFEDVSKGFKAIKLFPKGGFKAALGAITKKMGTIFSKTALKKIPGIGALFGFGYGISRILSGDVEGGLGEFASGLASLFPGPGTALSFAIDAWLAMRDMKGGGAKELGKKDVYKQAMDKVSNLIYGNKQDAPKGKDARTQRMYKERMQKEQVQQQQPTPINDGGIYTDSTGKSYQFNPKDHIKIIAEQKLSSNIDTLSAKDGKLLIGLLSDIKGILQQSGKGIFDVASEIGDLNENISKNGLSSNQQRQLNINKGKAYNPLNISSGANSFRNNIPSPALA